MADPLGVRLVQSLLTEQSLAPLTEAGIISSDLFDEAAEAYEWSRKYLTDKGEWPTLKMVSENCGVTLPSGEIDPLSYIADVIRKRTLSKSLALELKKASYALESRDPDAALRLVRDLGGKLVSAVPGIRISSYRDGVDNRIATYDLVKTSSGYCGISTPWERLNGYIQGWIDGTLNVLAALQSTGKTWWICINAVHCLQQGKKVLLVTLEMPTSRIERRLDAIKYKIPFKNLRDATMDPATEALWKDSLEKERTGVGDILIADKKLVRTVQDVVALVTEIKPDIVFIDGGYRFEADSSTRGQWEGAVRIVNALQWAAEITNIPWIVSTQQGDANETGKEIKRGPKMRVWNVRYAKEWAINPDVVIGLYQDKELRLANLSEMHLLKIREAVGESTEMLKINWNLQTMNFTEFGGTMGVSAEAGKVEIEF